MTAASSDTILITGGTGTTGRRIAARLEAAGHAVRAGSREGSPPFRWEVPATWDAVLDGVGAVYLCYHPDLSVPGAPEVVGAFAERAAARGVGRMVLLSGRGEADAERAERIVRGIAPRATIIRAAWFAQNFSENFLAGPVREGVVALPVGDVREPFIDVEDIADIAAAALTGDGHAGELYEVTGPRLMTFAEATAEIAGATGREIAYARIAIDDLAAGLADAGAPDGEVELVRYLFTEVLDGRNERLEDGVRRALGRPPRDFADYARSAAADGAWA
ncbi:MAG: SDR family oxidoreductase [Thermoleophilia bacterium]